MPFSQNFQERPHSHQLQMDCKQMSKRGLHSEERQPFLPPSSRPKQRWFSVISVCQMRGLERDGAKRPEGLARLQWSDDAPHRAQRSGNGRRFCGARNSSAAPSIAGPRAQESRSIVRAAVRCA